MLLPYILFYTLLALIIYTFTYKLYFIYVFLQYKDTKTTVNPQKKSIYFLVSVKNEAHQLLEFLTNLEQCISSDEYIFTCFIIDDHSDEANYNAMFSICSHYEWVEFLRSTSTPGKKYAIQEAYEKIASECIILLDADCRPQSEEWVNQLYVQLQKNDAVLGYAPFFKESSFVNKLIRFDCMWIAAQYFGYAIRKTPYMGVGRNMAIRQSSYKEVHSSIKGQQLLSGDDDLLIQAFAKANKLIGIVTEHKTFVYSNAEKTYARFLKQKTRQITTSSEYSMIHKILLASDSASYILFPVLLILSIFYLPLTIVISLFCIRFITAQVFYYFIAKKLNENDLRFTGGIMEFIYSLHLIILTLYSFVPRKKVWK